MEGYKQITREDLVKILEVFRNTTVFLSIFNFVKGSVMFDKFDFGIYKSRDNQTILSLTSVEDENCWDLELEEVEEIWIDENVEEYTYEELSEDMVMLKYYNDILVMIEF
jgi:hypothetical protein